MMQGIEIHASEFLIYIFCELPSGVGMNKCVTMRGTLASIASMLVLIGLEWTPVLSIWACTKLCVLLMQQAQVGKPTDLLKRLHIGRRPLQ